jgi:acid phosphatase
VSAKGVPAFDHVYVIMMENTSQSGVVGNANAPYINNTLLKNYMYTTNYSTSYHPSLPNYLDIVSGGNQGISGDGTPADFTPITAKHIGDFLDTANISWRNYAEDAGGPCVVTDSGNYATKHVPFLFFKDVAGTASVCQDRVVDYTVFTKTDINAPRRFSFITPNLCNDMHGGTISCLTGAEKIGDTWLSTNADAIIKKLGAMDALFVIWDEQTGSTGGAGTPMLNIIISPLNKKAGGTTATAYTHESFLATLEQGFGLPQTLGNSGAVSPINDVWK